MRLFRISIVVWLLAASIVLPGVAWAATPVATPAVPGESPVVPAYLAEFDDQSIAFPHYDLDLTLDVSRSTLAGTLTLTYPNSTGETLSELPLRLYPNAAYYDEGETAIAAVEIGGQAAAFRFDESGTVLTLELPAPLAPGETIVATIEFTTVVPINSDGSYGILNNDIAKERFVLADWYPVVAGRDETGWRLEPPTGHGDPTFSATGLFDVVLRVPNGFEVIASGTETALEDGLYHIESGPVRELALVVTRGLSSHSSTVGETKVTVHISPDRTTNGEHILEIASAALDFYNTAFGPYPFRELDLVEVPLALAYGVSWSGILFIEESQMSLPPERRASLDFTLLHEIGHQWWGGTVGANSNDHTWMVEGLTNATAILAQSAIQGATAATGSLNGWIVGPYMNVLMSSGDAVADVSIFDQSVATPLSTLAYGKGALGFLAIRNAIGHDAFMRGLASYASEHRLGIADPLDLRDAFETSARQSIYDIWAFWFESADTTPADVELLVAEIISSL